MIFWRWDWSVWSTKFCLNTDLSSSRNSEISFWTAKNYFDATSGAQNILKHEWGWYKWLQYHMSSDKTLFIKKLIICSKHLGSLQSQWKVISIKILLVSVNHNVHRICRVSFSTKMRFLKKSDCSMCDFLPFDVILLRFLWLFCVSFVITFFQDIIAIFVAPMLRCSIWKYVCWQILVAIGSPPAEIEGYPPPIWPRKFGKKPLLSMKPWI